MNVLITGGLGYIGSHTAVELLYNGHEIIIADNLSNSSVKVLDAIKNITEKNVKFYKIDLLDKRQITRVFCDNNIDAVIHFAGSKAVGESVANPLKYYKNNFVSTINLCEAMEEYNVYNLIFSSSATVYGNPESNPIMETFSTEAHNPYGKSKLFIEKMLTDIDRKSVV